MAVLAPGAGPLEAVSRHLADGFDIRPMEDAACALEAVRSGDLDALLTGPDLPDLLREALPALEWIVVVASEVEAASLAGLEREDAFGVLWPSLPPDVLRQSVARAVERHRLLACLRREGALMHGLLEALPDAVYLKDASGRYQRMNTLQARLLGLPGPEAALGRTDEEVLEPEPARKARRREERVLDTGRPVLDRLESRTDSRGRLRWYSCSRIPVLCEGLAVGLVGVSRDITHRRNVERRQRRLLALNESILGTMPSGLLVLDEDLRVARTNPRAGELLGLPSERLAGRPAVEVLPPDLLKHPEGLPALIRRVREARSPLVLRDRRIRTPEGVERVVNLRLCSPLTPKRDPQGPGRTLLVLEDVTSERLLEEQLRRAATLESLGRLAGGLAHEIGNILGMIGGYSELISEASPKGSTVAQDALAIQEVVDSATRMIRQLLSFAGQPPGERTAVGLNGLVSRVLDTLARPLGRDIQVSLRLEADPDRSFVDPLLFGQVLLNLVVNARDAMPGGGTLEIATARAWTTDEEGGPREVLRLRVSDKGHGMTRETLERVFEPFFTTKPREKGSGLGLATAYRIVTQHGGQIRVSSTLGRGTTFEIDLPPFAETGTEASPPT